MFTSSCLSFSWDPREHFTQRFSAKFAANYTPPENQWLLKDQRTLPIVFNHFDQVLSRLKKWSTKPIKNSFFANRTRKNPTNPTNQKQLVPREHDPWPFCCFYLMCALFRSVTAKNGKTLTPTRTGNVLLNSMDWAFYAKFTLMSSP